MYSGGTVVSLPLSLSLSRSLTLTHLLPLELLRSSQHAQQKKTLRVPSCWTRHMGHSCVQFPIRLHAWHTHTWPHGVKAVSAFFSMQTIWNGRTHNETHMCTCMSCMFVCLRVYACVVCTREFGWVYVSVWECVGVCAYVCVWNLHACIRVCVSNVSNAYMHICTFVCM